jgi:hypothetical protein
MGPERKENLGAQTERERSEQDTESLLLQAKRLMEEMQVLAEQSRRLAKEHAELSRRHGQLVEALKGRKRR